MHNQIQSQKYILHNFISKNEINELKIIIQNKFLLKESNLYKPYRYPDIDWNNISEFNQKRDYFKQQLDIEFLLVQRLTEHFRLNNFVSVGSLVQNGLVFNPYTLRILQPNKVDIHHHVENQAIPHYPIFFSELSKYLEVMNQFSFVLMIQKPEEGGQIILFKERWEGFEKIDSQRLRLDNLDKLNMIEDEIEDRVFLEEGDLLIFPAGIIWHKVSEVLGNKPRITIGGFMGKLKTDENTYGFWS
jgi:hypothetical protein